MSLFTLHTYKTQGTTVMWLRCASAAHLVVIGCSLALLFLLLPRRGSGGHEAFISVRFSGNNKQPSYEVIDLEDGSYDITYINTAEGTYRMSVLINEEHVRDSPMEVRVEVRCRLPTPAAANAAAACNLAHAPTSLVRFRDAA
jgi:hypothetical protein